MPQLAHSIITHMLYTLGGVGIEEGGEGGAGGFGFVRVCWVCIWVGVGGRGRVGAWGRTQAARVGGGERGKKI